MLDTEGFTGERGAEPGGLGRQRLGLVVAPLAAAAVVWFGAGLEPRARTMAGILAAVVVLWVTEAIPLAVTALLGVAFSVVLGVAPASEAFAPFADPLVFLFVGTFFLAQAIFFHHLDRRFALTILGLPGVSTSTYRALVAYSGVACAISMWISNTAATAMMFPIGLALLRALAGSGGAEGDSPFDADPVPDGGGPRAVDRELAAPFLLACSFGASIGGLATPVGTPPNLIGIGLIRRETGVDVGFFPWMAMGLPVVALLFTWSMVTLGRRLPTAGPEAARGLHEMLERDRARLGPWTRGQRNTLAAFALTVALWILPGIASLLLGSEHPFVRSLTGALPEGVVALLGAGLLFVLPVDARRHRFTLPWEEAVKIDWWIVFLYGGGMALGSLVFKTGLAEAMGRGLTSMLGVRSELALLSLSAAIAVALSESTSNVAAANMVVPVVIAFARSAGIDPVLPALGATMAASLGFMLPVSTPCNAIVYSSGRIPLGEMMRHGILLDVAGLVIVVSVVWLLGPIVLGLPR